jgi:hypothetical protein
LGSSSSSSAEEEVLTIIVSPVELTQVTTRPEALAGELEAIAKKFDLPLATLVTSGCVQVFRGAPLELVLQAAHVRPRI